MLRAILTSNHPQLRSQTHRPTTSLYSSSIALNIRTVIALHVARELISTISGLVTHLRLV